MSRRPYGKHGKNQGTYPYLLTHRIRLIIEGLRWQHLPGSWFVWLCLKQYQAKLFFGYLKYFSSKRPALYRPEIRCVNRFVF